MAHMFFFLVLHATFLHHNLDLKNSMSFVTATSPRGNGKRRKLQKGWIGLVESRNQLVFVDLFA